MYREGNNVLRYIFAYFLCSMCLFALFTTEIYGDTTAHNGDPDTYLHQEQLTETHTDVHGGTPVHKRDARSYHQQNPTKSHTDANRETNSHFQKPAKSNTNNNGDKIQPGTNSRFQKLAKSNMEINGNMLASKGELDTNPEQQKPTKSHTDEDTLSANHGRGPYSQQQQQKHPIKIRTKTYSTSSATNRRRAKRLKTRSLALPGEISLSDIPEMELSTSASSPVSPSSTMSNKTLSEAVTRAASNGTGVTRETAPVNFTAISVVPSEEAFPKELPLPLLIASPVAAVSIIIFVCVAYYCHSNQLDARARQLALKYAVISTEPPACSRGIPSTSSVDMDLIRKTSLRPSTSRTSTPNPTPNGSKRGSMNWVAIGDQEVITYTAARRHSTFIL